MLMETAPPPLTHLSHPPTTQHCWISAARVLVVALAQMQLQLQNQPQALPWTVPLNTAEVRGELATLLFALTKLSSRFPLFGQHGLFPRPPPCAL